jgi:hypothetical protein
MLCIAQLVFSGIALGCLGVVTLCAGAIRLYIELRPHFWEKIEGVIISSEKQIETYTGPIGGKASRIIPKIVFQYNWEGKTYLKTADIYSTGYEQSTKNLLSRFPNGKSVIMMINPHRPHLAELECKLTPVSCSLIVIGIALICAAHFLG